MMKCIIADAGPIIALCKIDKLNLLITLFKSCYITTVVYNEVISGNDIAVDCIKLAVEKGLLIIETTNIKEKESVKLLDRGEATSIMLALSKHDCALLIDEFKGRSIAKQLHIPVIGLAGILLLAKEKKLINAVIPLLQDVRNNGYWLSDKFLEGIARKLGEKYP